VVALGLLSCSNTNLSGDVGHGCELTVRLQALSMDDLLRLSFEVINVGKVDAYVREAPGAGGTYGRDGSKCELKITDDARITRLHHAPGPAFVKLSPAVSRRFDWSVDPKGSDLEGCREVTVSVHIAGFDADPVSEGRGTSLKDLRDYMVQKQRIFHSATTAMPVRVGGPRP